MISLDTIHSGLSNEGLEETERRLEALNASLWQNPYPFMELPFRKDSLEEMKTMAKEVHKVEKVVLLGIGGSSLGAQAIVDAFLFRERIMQKGPTFLPLDNIDPFMMEKAMEAVEEGIDRSVLVVASKSGETAETLSQFMLFQELMRRKGISGRVFVIVGKGASSLRKIADKEGYPVLLLPDDVPGRYSVLTPCGLFPSLLMGVEVEQLLQGAADMATHIRSKGRKENLSIRLSAYIYHLTERRNVLVIMPYCEGLGLFSSWLVQLLAESLGKRGRGFTPIRARGVTDQHSLLQLLVDGPKDKTVLFFYVSGGDVRIDDPFPYVEELRYLSGKELSTLFFSEFMGTRFSLWEASVPSITLSLTKLDLYTMGALFFLFEMVTVFLAHLLEVDPFTQEGVEKGKIYTKALMGKEGLGKERKKMERALEERFLLSFP